MSKTKRWSVAAVLGLALGLAGCNTPTLPLPPPSEGAIEARMESAGDQARVTGLQTAVEPYALVTCFNNRTGGGVVGLANGKGAFDIRVPATAGDVIEVWQRVGNDPPSVVIQVP
jgi:hypothetical protein